MNYLNYSQMVAAQNVNSDWLFEVEDAETLLRCALNRFFDPPRPLDAGEALEVGTQLRVCCDRIFGAVLSYRLAVGQDGPGVSAYFDSVADHREARELNEIADAAFNRETALSGAERAAFSARRLAAADMPAADAIRALRELLGGAEK